MRIITTHNILKVFWYSLVLISNFKKKIVSKSLKFSPKSQFLYFKPILVAIFVTIVMVKVKSMPEFYALVILLINQLGDFGEQQLSVIGTRGAHICYLMHLAL